MKKFILALLCVLLFSGEVFAELWQNQNLKISELGKVFIMPFETKSEAGTQLIPESQLKNNLYSWANNGINSALKKSKIKLTVKSLEALTEDIKFVYNDNVSVSDDLFFQHAKELGYNAFITCKIEQRFQTEHIPEQIRTYTEYREIQKRDSKGRIIETIRIPEEKTEITPAHDVTYLYTLCEPKLFMTSERNGEYYAASSQNIYREYQGGPVMKVVENIVNATMKELFTVNEKIKKRK